MTFVLPAVIPTKEQLSTGGVLNVQSVIAKACRQGSTVKGGFIYPFQSLPGNNRLKEGVPVVALTLIRNAISVSELVINIGSTVDQIPAFFFSPTNPLIAMNIQKKYILVGNTRVDRASQPTTPLPC